ncbi:MAG: multiple sugar transport system permease protein [Thermomicrobiales bacterium]|jgi:multiple sugar transport system permease protein|nr:multiple sugar transport system permease protein [Thermomicrobiales bacterium]MEA2524557.1 multiple sugar transport system permease protein [Thermomicrobiales bacterium]MEA2585548.1 multiple sugar transport system permease protein [Thermomicrobiales bacterium]MEA2596052.1 multiple sugar transport system permease protein [Thermomicrobiales bacterium]
MSDKRFRFTPSWLVLYPLLVLGALAAVIPFLWTLSTSLKGPEEVFAYPPRWIPSPFVWSNYADAFHIISGRTFLNSVIFAASIVLFQGLVTTMGGFAFARLRFPFRDQVFLLYLGTMMIPPQVTMIPTFIVVVELGWINTYQGLIVPIVAQGAFGTFMFRQFFAKIPNELYESARLDGANPLQLYLQLTLPLSRPVLTAYGVITFLTAWNMYLWPLIVVRSTEMKVVPMAIAELAGGFSRDRGVEMAAVSLSILPILVLWVIGQRWFVEGIALTGMKG